MFVVFTLILIAIALLFVVPPLRGKKSSTSSDVGEVNLEATRQRLRDIEKEADNDLIASEHLESIREETETTLLMEMDEPDPNKSEDKSAFFYKAWTTIIIICIPVFAFLIYLSVGTPTALQFQSAQQPQQEEQQLEQLIVQLEKRLSENPDDEQGWLVLAQTNMLIQRFDQGLIAMENLYRLQGDTPDVLSRYADALTMTNEGRFTDKAKQLIEKSLSLDGNHVHSLWLAGVEAYQAEQFESAIGYFEKAKANTDDTQNIVQINELIAAASERGKIDIGGQQQTPVVIVNVSVILDESLKGKINPNDTVFVFAKAAKGPPMPLAVSKHKASELPLKVTLNDSMAMMPELKLSGFDQVIISARISKSDQPIAQAGDLQGESAIINPNQVNEVNIAIDNIIQ